MSQVEEDREGPGLGEWLTFVENTGTLKNTKGQTHFSIGPVDCIESPIQNSCSAISL